MFCPLHTHLYTVEARKGFLFTFDPFGLPEIFGADKLDWCETVGSFDSKLNPNGWVRDHKVSVSAAIRNGYEPFYITHPLNCELMTGRENSKKKDSCSIAYADLVQQVDEYEQERQVKLSIRLRL